MIYGKVIYIFKFKGTPPKSAFFLLEGFYTLFSPKAIFSPQ